MRIGRPQALSGREMDIATSKGLPADLKRDRDLHRPSSGERRLDRASRSRFERQEVVGGERGLSSVLCSAGISSLSLVGEGSGERGGRCSLSPLLLNFLESWEAV